MNTIIALEELIKQEEEKVKFERKQLSEHESGENKLSRLALASTESKLEETQELLTKHKAMLEELLKQDLEELEEKQRLQAAIERKKYFEQQNMRIKNAKERSDDLKLEAMMIIDELPDEVKFEDEKIFEIANKSMELNLANHSKLNEELVLIQSDFQTLIKTSKDGKITELQMLNYRIPLLVLHFSVFLDALKLNFEIKDEEDTKENEKKDVKLENKIVQKKEETNEKKEIKTSFIGFPKYEDWWIKELWSSHQAYFALYKFKSIIMNFCKTGEQKRSWERIFDNWIFIKKLLNDKGELAFDYHFALDSLLVKYAQLEEELDNKNLLSMESIIKKITKKEDFTKVVKQHDIITPYLTFKKNKLTKH